MFRLNVMLFFPPLSMSGEQADLGCLGSFILTVFTQTGTKCENISVPRRRYFSQQIAPPTDVVQNMIKKCNLFFIHIMEIEIEKFYLFEETFFK